MWTGNWGGDRPEPSNPRGHTMGSIGPQAYIKIPVNRSQRGRLNVSEHISHVSPPTQSEACSAMYEVGQRIRSHEYKVDNTNTERYPRFPVLESE